MQNLLNLTGRGGPYLQTRRNSCISWVCPEIHDYFDSFLFLAFPFLTKFPLFQLWPLQRKRRSQLRCSNHPRTQPSTQKRHNTPRHQRRQFTDRQLRPTTENIRFRWRSQAQRETDRSSRVPGKFLLIFDR